MLMSPDLFLDCILYVINDTTEAARNLVRSLIALFENDSRNNTTIDHEVTRFYIRILKTILDTGVSKQSPDELRIILLKFKADAYLSTRNEVYLLLHDMFLSTEQMPAEKLTQYADRIRNTLLWHQCNKVTRSLYGTLSRAGDMVSPSAQADEMRKMLKLTDELTTAFKGNQTEGSQSRSLVEQVDLTDRESMKTALKKHQSRAVKGILRLGLQGLNRMLGKRGGLARGESLVFYALPHHYKSGLLMSIAGWIGLYNTPTSSSDGKKPLILLISLENEAYQNFVWMYRHHYETLYQKSSRDLTDDEVADWAYTIFSANGYTLIIERHMPSQFNFASFVETIERYKNSGYDVVLTSIDYPNLMAKDGSSTKTDGGNHLAVRDLFSALCNYTKTEGITFVSAHPMNRKAMELATSGITNIVKRMDTGKLADSFDVAREVDLEIFVHIERNLDGVAYLTMQRGKHRYVDDTPLAHQYCAYRFHKEFGIRDDVLIAPEYVLDIFSDPLAAEGERGEPNQPNETDPVVEAVF